MTALDIVEQKLQDIAFHQPHATYHDRVLADAMLVMLSVLRLHLSDHQEEQLTQPHIPTQPEE